MTVGCDGPETLWVFFLDLSLLRPEVGANVLGLESYGVQHGRVERMAWTKRCKIDARTRVDKHKDEMV